MLVLKLLYLLGYPSFYDQPNSTYALGVNPLLSLSEGILLAVLTCAKTLQLKLKEGSYYGKLTKDSELNLTGLGASLDDSSADSLIILNIAINLPTGTSFPSFALMNLNCCLVGIVKPSDACNESG